jgi:RNA recognition motif-containing protein
MDIYVGNLAYEANDEDLGEAFAAYGEVVAVRVIKDRYTGRSRGFAFIEMPDSTGQAAIDGLNGKDIKGRAITVNQARPREEGGQGGGGQDRRGGGQDRRDRY